jgi:threonine dehydratase
MITLDEIRRAAATIGPHVVRTPVVTSRTLSERLGTRVSLKLELFQRTGSFKPRGAFYQLMGLSDEQRARGVVGVSGGNFAQGLAYAGSRLGVATTVVMPEGSPANSVAATKGYGAAVELVPTMGGAFARFEELVETGSTPTHPFDNHDMMRGNGTLGLELIEDVPDATDVIVSIGGGGLIAGVATALKGVKPDLAVWGVETEGADAMARALDAGEIVTIEPTSIAKTLNAPWVSDDTLQACRSLVESVTVVPDSAALAAVEFLLERAKVLAEPAAACTLAAAERLGDRLGDHVVLVLCGGNVSLSDLVSWRAGGGAASG